MIRLEEGLGDFDMITLQPLSGTSHAACSGQLRCPSLGPVSSLSANLFGCWMLWPLRTLSWTALISCMHVRLTMPCRMIYSISPRWLEQM